MSKKEEGTTTFTCGSVVPAYLFFDLFFDLIGSVLFPRLHNLSVSLYTVVAHVVAFLQLVQTSGSTPQHVCSSMCAEDSAEEEEEAAAKPTRAGVKRGRAAAKHAGD